MKSRIVQGTGFRCLLAGLLATALLSASLPGQEAEATGREGGAAELDGDEQAHQQVLAGRIAVQQQRLENLQSEQGIYGPGLAEAYADLAVLYQELADTDTASRAYHEALQVVRINNGLYSEQQFPLLASLIELHSGGRDWAKVDDLQHLRLHIGSRLYGREDPAYLAAVSEYGRWRLRLIQENLLGQGSFSLMNAAEDLSEFYDDVLVTAGAGEVSPAALADILYGKARADLAIARAVAGTPYTAFRGTASPYITQTRCRNVTNAQGQVVRECYQVRVDNPRYRQSQRQAKRSAVMRYNGEIAGLIERLRTIRDEEVAITAGQREQLAVKITELENEFQAVNRTARRRLPF